MKSLSIFNRRAGTLFATAGLVLSTTVPAFVSAATVTERSVELGSSATSAVTTYTVGFKTPAGHNVGSFDVTFTDSPSSGGSAPTGFSSSAAGVTGVAYTNLAKTANKVSLDMATPGTTVSAELTDITNPSAAGTFYAHIDTYAGAQGGSRGAIIDTGVVAISATNGFEVSGQVLETLTFCVAGAVTADDDEPLASCDVSGRDAPNVALGTNGILDASAVNSGPDVHTFLATNAASGVVVNLKSSSLGCGGLSRQGAATIADGCAIEPLATAGSLVIGTPRFGAKVAVNTGDDQADLALNGSWNATTYYMNWVTGDASGVTSPYGDTIFKTDGPTNGGSADLSFGATSSNVVPAGNYSANLSLIATGKF